MCHPARTRQQSLPLAGDDDRRGLVRRSAIVVDDVTAIDPAGIDGRLELGVHVTRCCLVGERVVGTRAHAVDGALDRREQDDVVDEFTDPGRLDELVEEPRTDHTVVDRVVPVAGEPSGRGRGHLGDDRVLGV